MENRKSYFLDGTSIEIFNDSINLGKIKHAVFDFDGTLSLIRDGWQNVMVPMMIDLLAETPTNETVEELETIVVEFVDRLTGKQTIYQMMQLCDEIRKRSGQLKTPIEYKDLYNSLLLPIVEDRIAKLERGEISAETLRLPNSIELLRMLRDRNVRLYLASGTDVEFVKHEAELLEITDLLDGGIFGALRDYKNFSKAMVIQKIIDDFQLSGSELLIVGDGYVEIENAKSVGAIAVGFASIEQNDYNMNADKRDRLIRVGADIIIDNYDEIGDLIEFLFDEK